MKIFLIVSGILAWLFSTALFLVPDKFYEPTGIVLTPLLATLAQAHGATLFGLGVANFLVRNATQQQARPILIGNLFVQILSLLVVLRTMQLGAGAKVVPGVAIHIILASFNAFFWLRKAR